MGESFVRFCHAVNDLFLLHCAAAAIRRIQKLAHESVFHRFFAAAARVRNYPSDSQRVSTGSAYFERNLIGSTADTSGFHFECRGNVVESSFEYLQWLIAAALTDLRHSTVKDLLGDRFFPFPHQPIDELRHRNTVVDRIRKYFSFCSNSSSWHISSVVNSQWSVVSS